MTDVVIAVGDIETTGLRQEDGHRIIEFAVGIWRYNAATGAKKVGSWCQRIDPKRDIDPGAQAVHGISRADLVGMPTWEDVAPKIEKIMNKANIFIAHNAAFDAPFIALELVRAGFAMPKFQVFCTMENGRACTSMGKVPNLGELAWATGVDYDPDAAHAADYDVEVLESCYWNGVKTGLFKDPVAFLAGAES